MSGVGHLGDGWILGNEARVGGTPLRVLLWAPEAGQLGIVAQSC